MKPDRFEQVDHIFQGALQCDASEREAFLNRACGGDAELRSRVDTLISSDQEAGSFIERPAFEVVAAMMAAEHSRIESGQVIGPYKVISRLGSGGMGDVYLAHDSRLGRKVALKLLPEYFTRDEQRLRRFQQEARAASALNHPNVITIFEIGKVGSIHFIASEYIAGQTLRERMSGRRMMRGEALDITIQVASALESTHQAGIVHRDIKPENIMVRHDGYVKVLDFGLAKLTEGAVSDVATEVPAIGKASTDPGVVMGTVSYMSPEQARGREVDSRTDIFSLGVTVYEMVTGRQPFEGETWSDVIAAILTQEFAPLVRYSSDVPEGLELIVARTLAKDTEERYQTVTEMLFDLRTLKHRLDHEDEQQRSVSPDLRAASVTTKRDDATETGSAVAGNATIAEYLIGKVRRDKRGALLTLVIFILAAAGIGIGLYKLIGRNKAATPFQTVKISNLTTSGQITQAAISPDGKYVAHVVEDQGKESLWVRQVATTSSQQIVPPAEVLHRGLTFSTDGNFIYYTVWEWNRPYEGALYQVPVLASASPPRKLLTNIDTAITFSPDGKQFAYGMANGSTRESALMIANANGSGARALVTKQGSLFLEFPWLVSSPVWSPDGKVIACGFRNISRPGNKEAKVSVIGISVEDGSEKLFTSHRWLQVGRLAWLPDGVGLIVSAAERLDQFQMWHLSYPAGEARRITNDDSKNYRGMSLTADASLLVTTQNDEQSSIWVAPEGDANRAQRITQGRYEGRYGVAWTPDGRIIYNSLASGNEDIWIMNADGSGQSQLTVDPGTDDNCCAVSPDGRYVIFRSQTRGGSNISRMDIDGGNLKQLARGGDQPSLSPDGKWVVYHLGGRLWKISIDGGEPAQLNAVNHLQYFAPANSPIGNSIACLIRDNLTSNRRLAIIPPQGGAPVKVFDDRREFMIPDERASGTQTNRGLQWTPDGQAITFVKTTGGVSNIWSQPLNGGTPKQLTDFKSDSIFSFNWSRDGKKLVYARGAVNTDVVLVRDSQ